jgi:hypothetical protein
MYHVNSAVIKSLLSSMPKEQFVKEAKKIKQAVPKFPHGSTKRSMYVKLYQWCVLHYKRRFQ